MKTKAAVAWKAGQALTIETVDLEGPKFGEVLVEIKATGICHTDYYTLSGADPEGIFPAILGHEGAGIVVDVGPGVTTLKKGDHVIPLYTPECRQCKFCLSRKTNLCQLIRGTQGKGLMPDATSRFSLDGQPIFHYMGTSTFSNYTVAPEISLAKIREDAPFDKVCYIGCGVTTGIGAVLFTAKVEAGANVVVFGLGGIGLNVIQGCVIAGALVIQFTGWRIVDPIVAIGIGLWVLPRTWILLKDTTHILLEGAPSGVDLAKVRKLVVETPGVAGIHDLHVWVSGADQPSCSVHVVLMAGADDEAVRLAVAARLEGDFDLHHLTVQTERVACADQEGLHP